MTRRISRTRIERLERKSRHWASRLGYVDYIGDEDYGNEDWTEIHHEDGVTVFEHSETGEIRGVIDDRRSDAEIEADGGNLQFL